MVKDSDMELAGSFLDDQLVLAEYLEDLEYVVGEDFSKSTIDIEMEIELVDNVDFQDLECDPDFDFPFNGYVVDHTNKEESCFVVTVRYRGFDPEDFAQRLMKYIEYFRPTKIKRFELKTVTIA